MKLTHFASYFVCGHAWKLIVFYKTFSKMPSFWDIWKIPNGNCCFAPTGSNQYKCQSFKYYTWPLGGQINHAFYANSVKRDQLWRWISQNPPLRFCSNWTHLKENFMFFLYTLRFLLIFWNILNIFWDIALFPKKCRFWKFIATFKFS